MFNKEQPVEPKEIYLDNQEIIVNQFNNLK